MNIQEVFDLLNNVGVDFDHAFGDQCVDLAQIFNRLYKSTILTGANASDIWDTYPKDFYDKIENTPEGFPQEGDIIIWKGPPGHIAISTKDTDKNRFKSFDQNYPTDSFSHIQEHNYNNVLGWLRPKNPPINQQAELDQLKTARDKNWNFYQTDEETIKNLNAQIKKLQADTSTKDGEISNLKIQLLNETSAKETAQAQANQNGDTNALYVQLKKNYDSDKISWNAEASRNKQQITTLQNQLDTKKPKNWIDRLAYIFSK